MPFITQTTFCVTVRLQMLACVHEQVTPPRKRAASTLSFFVSVLVVLLLVGIFALRRVSFAQSRCFENTCRSIHRSTLLDERRRLKQTGKKKKADLETTISRASLFLPPFSAFFACGRSCTDARCVKLDLNLAVRSPARAAS